MKLKDIVAEAPPTKIVPLRFANSEEEIQVGLRMLTVQERADALCAARVFANENKVPEWDEKNPICALGLYVETVARAAYSASEGVSIPFATKDELLNHPLIGQENLAYLYESYQAFEEELQLSVKTLNQVQVVEACLRIAQNDDDFLGRMRPGMLRTLLRFTASQYVISVIGNLPSFSDESQSQEPLEKRTTTTSSEDIP